mmetsp:Transcript_85512/g.135602  ORF Transcript_85512/g.135602 Transcript_85512/m.135602 type:complete len:216 (-) Transcript_85512:63-710(-)
MVKLRIIQARLIRLGLSFPLIASHISRLLLGCLNFLSVRLVLHSDIDFACGHPGNLCIQGWQRLWQSVFWKSLGNETGHQLRIFLWQDLPLFDLWFNLLDEKQLGPKGWPRRQVNPGTVDAVSGERIPPVSFCHKDRPDWLIQPFINCPAANDFQPSQFRDPLRIVETVQRNARGTFAHIWQFGQLISSWQTHHSHPSRGKKAALPDERLQRSTL